MDVFGEPLQGGILGELERVVLRHDSEVSEFSIHYTKHATALTLVSFPTMT